MKTGEGYFKLNTNICFYPKKGIRSKNKKSKHSHTDTYTTLPKAKSEANIKRNSIFLPLDERLETSSKSNNAYKPTAALIQPMNDLIEELKSFYFPTLTLSIT